MTSIASIAVNGFAVLVMLTLLLTFLREQSGTGEWRMFITVTISLCLFLAASSVHEYAEMHREQWPLSVRWILQCLTLSFCALFPALWGRLTEAICCEGETEGRWNRYVYKVLFWLEIALIMINIFRPILFDVNAEGILTETSVGMTAFIVINYVSLLCTMIRVVSSRAALSQRVLVTLMCVPLGPMAAMIVDLIFSDGHHSAIYALAVVVQYTLFQYTRCYRDTLTGLGNRAQMQSKLESWFSSGHKQTICGIILDIDALRDINREEGHKAGDIALQQVAAMLKKIAHRKLIVVRYGGDEFLVLWTTRGAADPNPILSEIRRERAAMNAGKSRPIRFSVGEYHCTNQENITAENFLASVDRSLYQKKREIDRILNEAVESKAFRIVFQPIYSLRTNRYRAAEALTRLTWNGKVIPPDEFIPASEESGVITFIGEFVLSEACAFIASESFKVCGLEMIDVNLSAAQCMDPMLTKRLVSIVDSYGVEHEKICFEITETAIVSDKELFWRNIHALTEQGFGLALDDFGSGYSNLRRLNELPLDFIKLDKTLAPHGSIEECGMLADLVRYLRHISAEIIMEGVETEEQMQTTKALGCDAIQGYYYAKAMNRDVLTEFLKEANER